MLSVEKLSHWFGPKRVLTDISLQVQEGEILAIMGSSGGGKTTLLRCISGLITATEGSIHVSGIDVRKDPDAARQKLGLVFQSAALFDYLNVRDNIAFGSRRQLRAKSSEIDRMVAAMLELVHLEGSETLMPSELSGGMRKRVGLARALAMNPEVVLYDEPTSGLDPITAYAIDQLIVETRDALGVTSVVVSHDLSSVFRVADRIAFLESGELAFLGTPEDFRVSQTGSIRELVEKARSEKFLEVAGNQ